jgi:hypothetical protein
MRFLRSKFTGVGLVIAVLSVFAAAGEETAPKKTRRQETVQIKAVPWGPSQADVNAAKARAERSAAVQNELRGAKYRFVAFEYIENSSADKSQPELPPTRFRVTFYDYTNDRAIIAEGDFAGKEAITARRENFAPGVGGEELEAAIELVKKDAAFAKSAGENKLDVAGAMPPVTIVGGERLINISARNYEIGENQIVGVSFKNEKIVRYENNAPPTAAAGGEICGIPNAGQGSTGPGLAGQLMLTVTFNGNTTWEMLVIRPSASSGNPDERSGIEIRDVKYKGKSVLKRGNAPILNVKYIDGSFCGPFRDWQYAEGFFNAPAAGANDAAPGFRVLADGQIATTAIETGDDTGNFQGVAIYKQDVGNGQEIVLVTEMNAGWYRYIMEWRFAPDGTIRPRYGFASHVNTCVCVARTHHVYWRFDFDIVQPGNKVFQIERGRKFMRPVTTEAAIFRSYQTNRGFLIQNAVGNEAYSITPGSNDGAVATPFGVLTDTFGAGDFWLMRYKTGATPVEQELDDPNSGSAANLAPWINGESLENQDLVVWYGAHRYRVDESSFTGARPSVLPANRVIGPDLRPVRW